MNRNDINAQFEEWAELLNGTAMTIGFVSEIAALSAQSIPISALSLFVMIVYIEFNRKKFPKLITKLRQAAKEGRDDEFQIINDILKQAENEYFSVRSIFKNFPLYWLVIVMYILGFIALSCDPLLLVWHPHMITTQPTLQPAQ